MVTLTLVGQPLLWMDAQTGVWGADKYNMGERLVEKYQHLNVGRVHKLEW